VKCEYVQLSRRMIHVAVKEAFPDVPAGGWVE
jgi:hypothetical protein